MQGRGGETPCQHASSVNILVSEYPCQAATLSCFCPIIMCPDLAGCGLEVVKRICERWPPLTYNCMCGEYEHCALLLCEVVTTSQNGVAGVISVGLLIC